MTGTAPSAAPSADLTGHPDDGSAGLALARAAVRRAAPGHYDEWLDGQPPGAEPSARWQNFFRHLGSAGWADLPARQRRVQQRLREDAASYNIHAEPDAGSRPWPLVLLPLILDADEWAVIEHGVLQRARVLEATLADLYGPQTLLRDALLPASLVFAHPHYLRPMHQVQPLGGTRLHLLAFDVARAPEGGFCVLAQRLQAPTGLGYLLQNRLIVRPQLADPFAGLHVQRLAASFRAWLNALMSASPAGDRSRIVLLTPGPQSATYFEQVFLARYLGLTLVEGGDLTVRANRLYLKALHGLEQVHVVLRRIDDEWLDPLELRAESDLGIPGLLQALRAGQVVMANAPGAGVLESPGFAAFWPAVAERLLEQKLLLPAPTSWWCGEASVWARQRPRLASFVVSPTFPDSASSTIIAAQLSCSELDALAQRIAADPAAYTLQTPLLASETPVWVDGQLQPQAAVMRVFALADGMGAWRVLPGAMTRLAARGEHPHGPWLPMKPGSASADTWVIARGAVDSTTLLPRPLSAHDLQDWQRTVTSRTAENLFWLGRTTERAENLVRLARLTLESLGEASPPGLSLLVELTRWHGLVGREVPVHRLTARALEQALVRGLGDVEPRSRGVVAELRGLRRCAQALRERLSPEHWKLIHEVDAHFEQHLADALNAGQGQTSTQGGVGQAEASTPDVVGLAQPSTPDLVGLASASTPDVVGMAQASTPDLVGVLARAATHLAAITGAQTDRMTRDDGWRLLSVGRQIDRMDMLSHALALGFERRVHETEDGFLLLLGLFDSVITYRAQFQARREVLPLLHLLVYDTDNPRSLAWVARTMRDRLRKLARHDEAWARSATADLPAPETWSLADLDQRDTLGRHTHLIAALRHCSSSAQALSDAVGRHLFAHVTGSQRSVWQ